MSNGRPDIGHLLPDTRWGQIRPSRRTPTNDIVGSPYPTRQIFKMNTCRVNRPPQIDSNARAPSVAHQSTVCPTKTGWPGSSAAVSRSVPGRRYTGMVSVLIVFRVPKRCRANVIHQSAGGATRIRGRSDSEKKLFAVGKKMPARVADMRLCRSSPPFRSQCLRR